MSEMQLTVRPQDATVLTFDEIMTIGPILAESGYFTDAAKANQAIVKVLAGREIGIGPVASMTGIHVIKGKPAVGANVMAAAVKSNPKYDYRVRSMDNTVCSIEFFERGQSLGLSTFTIEDARKAGTQNLDKFARNMLFARAISNGVRWYCPDTFSSAVGLYTPEELGAQVDEDGDVIEAVTTIIKDEPPTTQKPTNGDQKPARKQAPQPRGPQPEPDADPLSKSFTQTELQARMAQALINVNAATSGHYDSTAHLFQAMKTLDPQFVWPHPANNSSWSDVETVLIERTKTAPADAPF